MDLAETCVFGKQSPGPILCGSRQLRAVVGPNRQELPFSRSYGDNLPSSLTIVLSIALVFSTRLPVSVWGTGTRTTRLEAFPGSMGSATSPKRARLTPQACNGARIFLVPALRASPWSTSATVGLPFSVPPSLKRHARGAGMSTCCPSPTTFALGLGPD